MNTSRIFPAALLAALATVSTVAVAQTPAKIAAPAAVGCVQLQAGWIRLPPAPVPMLAGFGHLENKCSDAQAVVAARSPYFGEVTVHETTVVDGVSRMRPIGRLPLAAGGHAELRPGGLHLMLMQPQAPVSEGQQVPLVLVLADGSEVSTTLVVRKAAPAAGDAGHGAHHGHGHH